MFFGHFTNLILQAKSRSHGQTHDKLRPFENIILLESHHLIPRISRGHVTTSQPTPTPNPEPPGSHNPTPSPRCPHTHFSCINAGGQSQLNK